MDTRYRAIVELAREQHGAVSTDQLEAIGAHRRLRSSWTAARLLERRGVRSYVIGGSPATWKRELRCARADVDGVGFIAGRSAARLHGLDGFRGEAVELRARGAARRSCCVPRPRRSAAPTRWRSTASAA